MRICTGNLVLLRENVAGILTQQISTVLGILPVLMHFIQEASIVIDAGIIVDFIPVITAALQIL